MKKITILLLLITSIPLLVFSKEIKLTEKEESNWKIKTALLETSQTLPLGTFIVEVTTPPTLLHSVSLPFSAQVLSLNVATYQSVNKGDLLANVTGTEWIEVQKEAIADAIELRHHRHLAERKNRLCREDIIPKKECVAANAELKTDQIKLAASKAHLQSFGASPLMVQELLNTLEIKSAIPISAPTDGIITTINAQPGKSTDTSSALFVIQKQGALWLESDMPLSLALTLKEGQAVQLRINNTLHNSKVLQLSPTVDVQNQSRHVRFSVGKESTLLAGMHTSAKVILLEKSLRVPKKSVIKEGDDTIVFVKKEGIYQDIVVSILSEDKKYYYLQDDEKLHFPIVTTSVAILKSMMGEDDE